MPNGYYGSAEAWQHIQTSLQTIDPVLTSFANRHGLTLSQNARAWPERSLRWGSQPERVIQIFLTDEHEILFDVWLCAWEDRFGQRYWKRRFVAQHQSVGQISTNLEQLLQDAKEEGRFLVGGRYGLSR